MASGDEVLVDTKYNRLALFYPLVIIGDIPEKVRHPAHSYYIVGGGNLTGKDRQ